MQDLGQKTDQIINKNSSFLERLRNKASTKAATIFTAVAFALAGCGSDSSSFSKSCEDDSDCQGKAVCSTEKACQGKNGEEYCFDDFGCLEDQVCEDNLCKNENNSPEEKFFQSEKKTTNFSGMVSFVHQSENIPVNVRSELGSSLEGIVVHYIHKGNKNIVLSVDPLGNYFPEVTNFSLSETDSFALTLNENLETQKQPLLGAAIVLIMKGIGLGNKIYKEASKMQWGDLLEEGKDVNKYCMTLAQMQNDYIDVPAGLILLAAEQAGYDTEEIKIAVTTPLKEIFETYILYKYGEQAGYEVWSPKEAVNLCGGSFEGVVCDITTESLSQKVWNPDGVPVWKIVGACIPKSSCTPQSIDNRCFASVILTDNYAKSAREIYDKILDSSEITDGKLS